MPELWKLLEVPAKEWPPVNEELPCTLSGPPRWAELMPAEEPKCELLRAALLKRDPEPEVAPRELNEEELPKCELSMLETARFVETADAEPREAA